MMENDGFKSLIYAVRLPVLMRIGGKLAVVVAVLCLPSVAAALWFAEYRYVAPFALLIALLLAVAWLTRKLPVPRHLQRSEGLVVSCGAFILTPLLLSVALWPSQIPWVDRWFETVSAVTTTGLSTLPRVSTLDKTVLFTRAWMQWYGGLGIVVLSVTLLMQRSLAAFQLLEVPEGQGFVSAATVYARRVLQVYAVLTALSVLIAWLCLGDFFSGLVHGLSAISTGGFSSRDDSLSSLSLAAQCAMMLPCVLGALSLAIYLRLGQRAWRSVYENQELRHFLCWLLAFGLALVLLQGQHSGFTLEVAVSTAVLGISALTTTGFANQDLAAAIPALQWVLMMAMFLGGCLGSTAGGFKVFRLLVFWQLLLNTLRRASASPHAVIEPRIQGKVLTQEQIQVAMLTGSLLVVLIALSWIPFLLYGVEPLNALFEVVSAVGTVGLSTGVTRQDMPPLLKVVLCIDMTAGRVEVLALLCLCYPGVWLGHRNTNA